MIDFDFAISSIMVSTASYVLLAIVLLQPALTTPRQRESRDDGRAGGGYT